MSSLLDIINRYKHNRGFGIQSPAAFYLVTEVLNERLPYYAYEQLAAIAKEGGEFSVAHCKLLFRLANYIKPQNIISFSAGSGSAASAMIAGKRRAVCYVVDECNALASHAKVFLAEKHSREHYGDEIELLQGVLDEVGVVGLLHIGNTPKYGRAVESALSHVNNNSVIIVEGIHRTKELKEWWRKMVEDSRTIVTFDMYSMGVIFFDNNYKKQHYTLKMK